MRKSLFSAAALAPLLLLAAQGTALADPTTITDDLTSGIATSTFVPGIPSDLILSSQGSIKLDSGTAVTVDSDNTFENDGAINIEASGDADNSNNATGVLILGGHTGGFDNKGSISVTEDYNPDDTNGDGVVDGPWAKGSGRYGVRVTGPAPFVGDIFNEGGAITVEGNNSFGMSVETLLQGNLKSSGQIAITGDNSAAIAETSGVTGNVQITGAITANGQGVKGVDLSGDIGGSLSIYNAITATGYRITARPQDPDVIANLDPSNLLQGGPAVDVRASVAKGIYLGAPPAGTTTDTDPTADVDKDGIPDVSEPTSAITVFGGAPALKIGDTGKDVHVGLFGTDAYGFGLIVAGNVSASGLFDGVAATGIQIGAAGGTTTIDGGMRAMGVINTASNEADANSIHILGGGTVSRLQLEGQVNTTVQSAGSNQGAGILIDAGATAGKLVNIGVISTSGSGNGVSSYGVEDKSGTLDDILNKGTISATVRPSEAGGAITGRSVAFDLSANTSGISFVQAQNTDTPDAFPLIAGDILLGTGDDNVQLLAGAVLGALDFNAGGGSLLLDNGATLSGALTASGTLSSVNINNGTLIDTSASTINTGSLNVGATSTLVVSADPLHSTSTVFNVSGSANLAAGSKLGLNLLSLPKGTQSFTVINAGSLTSGNADSALLTQTPFLVIANAHTDAAAGDLTIDVRRRTAQEAGFNRAETAAYDSVYDDLGVDSGIQRAFLAQQTQAGLLGLYDQMLPDHAGGILRTLSWAAEAAQDAAAHAPEQASTQAGPTRGWTQEIAFSETKDRGDASAYRILGFGIVAGLESVSARGNAIGVDASFTTGNVSNPDTPGDDNVGVQQIGLGVYWRGTYGGLHVDAQAGGGYMWANGRREFIYADTAGVVHKLSESDWNGYSVYGRVGAYYDINAGRLYFRPNVHLDYFRLHEGGYTETGGGDGFDLTVDGRDGDQIAGTASFIIGYTFGDEVKWRPEVEIGYRGIISGSGGDTTAAFTGGGTPFTLMAEDLRGGGPIGRIGIHAFGQFVDLKIDAGAQLRDNVTDVDLRMMVRIVF
jgi:hypothetical protein